MPNRDDLRFLFFDVEVSDDDLRAMRDELLPILLEDHPLVDKGWTPTVEDERKTRAGMLRALLTEPCSNPNCRDGYEYWPCVTCDSEPGDQHSDTAPCTTCNGRGWVPIEELMHVEPGPALMVSLSLLEE